MQVDVLGPQGGHLAKALEGGLLKHIASIRDPARKIQAKGKLSKSSPKGSLGSREIWYEDELSVESLSELIELAKVGGEHAAS